MAIIGNKSIKEFVGSVVSDKQDQTIVVQVSVVKVHPLYKKRFTKNKKFYVHDQDNEAHVGDVVRFRETSPISKTKRRKLIEIVTKSLV